MSDIPSVEELNKLNVAQLKALCKGRINGYSKLPKAALIEKLVQSGASSLTLVTTSTAAASSSGHPSATAEGSRGSNTKSTVKKSPVAQKQPLKDSTPENTSQSTIYATPNETTPAHPTSRSQKTSSVAKLSMTSAELVDEPLPKVAAKKPAKKKAPEVTALETPSAADDIASSSTQLAVSSTESIEPATTSLSTASKKVAKPKTRKNKPADVDSEPLSIAEKGAVELEDGQGAGDSVAPPKKPAKKAGKKKDEGGEATAAKKPHTTKKVKEDKGKGKETAAAANTTSSQSASAPAFPVLPSDIVPASVSMKLAPIEGSTSTKRPSSTEETGSPPTKKSKPAATPSTHRSSSSFSLSPTPASANTSTPAKPTTALSVNACSTSATAKFHLPVIANQPATAAPVAGEKRPSDAVEASQPWKKVKTVVGPAVFTSKPGKRFQKLVVKPKVANAILPATKPTTPNAPSTRSRLYFLESWDLPLSPPQLTTIPRPPKMNQRKLVPATAHAVSFLDFPELLLLSRVSKLFRYAVLASAQYKLMRTFGGQRLDEVIAEKKSLNLWPYLHQRKHEMSTRQTAVNNTFLPRALRNPSALSARVWASEDERKVTIALRFFLTRLWFMVTMGSDNTLDPLAWSRGTVVDTCETARPDVWKVTLQSSLGGLEVFYVVKETCEVLGAAQPSIGATPMSSSIIGLRADWLDYIFSPDDATKSLQEHIKWTNHEEYERGVARGWLKRIANEGEVGEVKRTVAERYVLASVFGNSVSGKWMHSQAQENAVQGIPQDVSGSRTRMNVQVFVAATHHVESVHLDTKGKPLHPALAVIHTLAREYYVLRGNGMPVGCEEDGGIPPVWGQILDCTADGLENREV